MSARITSLAPGSSPDAAVNGIIDFAKNGFGDTQMFGLLARRPELLKRAAAMFAYFLAGQGGLIEPPLLELMRLRGANLNACTYCATVRLQPVVSKVKPKEPSLGLRDISGMTKAQAVAALRNTLDPSRRARRQHSSLWIASWSIRTASTTTCSPSSAVISGTKRSSNWCARAVYSPGLVL